MEEILNKWLQRLDALKEERRDLADINTDSKNRLIDYNIRQVAEICRDLKQLSYENPELINK